ncbi:hypothetical protein DO021_09875 [Desulfobacter hydrogenophilus]|uniref:Sulfotransferase n=1 Tax=Desulfobacter hydrogenophilus TaxID=2291 RepID=A0A328FBR7_9BACT|nr:sulfotransferase [Desulfobacter hydrogenophilus]NDY70475.1 sulfotransferase [Desulfobacter hydrogenophilus]QBH13852.1 sulfotransferase [Desulfobacter hydrogenophilus]RAM02081.1 hypothetical protein DO021_09875 [Desulfobacter hydrogenophilus]
MENYCFISSMFRSGSTMLARMLNTHKNVACASDPMRPIFNSFRYDLAKNNYKNAHKRFDPLDDYFLQSFDLFQQILKGTFDVKPGIDHRRLFEVIQNRAMAFSGNWAEQIEVNDFNSYSEYIKYFTNQIDKIYGENKNNSYVIFKEVWALEFFPALKKLFPNIKCIAMVRDPRDIVASKNATGLSYPYFFMGRQWRKLAFLSSYLNHLYKDDFYVIKYEDLVSQSDQYVKNLCAFLGIEFEQNLLDTTQYKDGSGNPWFQNTSYGTNVPQYINSKSIGKWKSQLNDLDVRSIELICNDWMQHFDYQLSNSRNDLLSMGVDDFRIFNNNELATWIRPFAFDRDREWLSNQMLIEKMRSYEKRCFSDDENFRLQIKWW